MICCNCGTECSNNNFDAYPLYPKNNRVCGKCVFEVIFKKNDCNMVGINYKTKDWSYYPLKAV
tara:strand:- start:204 stop:392 length:189 start_codon:yes stop_codon:yes gene_type:complete